MPSYPKELSSYKIIKKKIGSGGFAVVHKARCSEGIVALKVPKDVDITDTMDNESFGKFREEANLWYKLSKRNIPGIVKLYQYGLKPYPWMAMEYMSGGTLNDRINDIDVKESISITCSLLEALHYAHHNGVIHRDIKPENILFTKDGEHKLTDWGLGKVLLDVTTSVTGTFKGTVRYSAPEQFDSNSEIDWRTDIFQVGAVFYHMLAGKPPVPNDLLKAMNIVTQGKITPLNEVNTKVPERLSYIVMKSLSVNKKDRWNDAEIFRQAIMGKLDSQPDNEDSNWDEDVTISLSQVTNNVRRYCYSCGNLITSKNKQLKCKECDTLFCDTCESWIDKINTYRGNVIKLRYPLCVNCYYIELEKEKEKIHRTIEDKNKWYRKDTHWVNSFGTKFVKIPDSNYYLGIYTITQKEWIEVMGTEPWSDKEYIKMGYDYPATNISWNDCRDFLHKLNRIEEIDKYRFPTEYEWENACRAGSRTDYYFGNNKALLGNYAWYNKNTIDKNESFAHRVGLKEPNDWGLYDMHGNIWEWCNDKFNNNSEYRVIRGGGWNRFAKHCLSNFRGKFKQSESYNNIGLRIVRSQ